MFAIREERDYVNTEDFEKAIMKIMKTPKQPGGNYYL